MCGLIVIAGCAGARMSGESAFESLRHRGPDSFGYEAVASSGCLFEFGHTRLAIQDLSVSGAQPMWSSDGRWLIAFNGEIYNHQDLRQHLVELYASTFRGQSDTETLLELIAREGVEAAVMRLDGMFAFVVLDRSCGALYAVRDTAGIKPLYYVEEGQAIAFSSEVRGLTAHGFDPGTPDEAAAATYLRLRYVPSSGTIYSRLRRVFPGGVLRWQSGRLHRSAFRWHTRIEVAQEFAADSRIEHFGALLEKSVRDQLIADVPLGVLLSGGLDSAVLATSLKRAGVTPPCFTVGFTSDADGRSEIADAAETARLLDLPHFPLSLTLHDLTSVEGNVIDHLEEPLGTTSVLAMWHLCRHARSRVTVALAGQGADEPLGGYRRHRLEALRSRLPSFMKTSSGARTHDLYRFAGNELGRALRSLSTASWVEAHLEAREVFSGQEILKMTAVQGTSADEVYRPWLSPLADAMAGRSDLSRSLWLDVRTQLSDDLLLYGDKISMAHSLEVRVPFLGAPLLAAMEQLPDRWRTSPRQSKRILRAWAHAHVPTPIMQRRKRGFQIPNLFRNADFLRESKERASACLGRAGPFYRWNTDQLMAVLDKGAAGGAAEVRAWTIHSLARWMENQCALVARAEMT